MTRWQEPCDVHPFYDVIEAQRAPTGGDCPR
jgi:hypothetical protein